MSLKVIYLLAVNGAMVLLVALAVYSWTRRRSEGWARMAATGLIAAALDVFVVLLALAPSESARTLLSLKYSLLGASNVALFLFVAGQTGRWRQPTRRQLVALLAVPVLGHLAAWHDGLGSIRSVAFGEVHGMTAIVSITFGPLYWITTAYHYGLMITSLVYVVSFIGRGGPIERGQGAALLVGVLAPGVLNLLGVIGVLPRGLDLTPLGQAVAALALFWGALRHRMLDIVPIARHALVDALQDGILIVDPHGRVVDINRRLALVLGIDAAAVIGHPLGGGRIPSVEAERALAAVVAAPLPVDAGLSPEALRAPLLLGDRVYDVRGMAVGTPPARVLVVQDVTERQRWHDQQARLIAQLQTALTDVKTLSGLLPICAGCKQIRDSEGAWQPLEHYIRDRTDAEFSHGMCPECVSRWYPEFDVDVTG